MIEFVMNNFTGVAAMVIFIVLSLIVAIFCMADSLSKTQVELETYKAVLKRAPSDGFIYTNVPEKEGYYICEYRDLNTGETLKGVLYFDGNGKWMDPKNDFRYQNVIKYKVINME